MRILLVEEKADRHGDRLTNLIGAAGWNLAHRCGLDRNGAQRIGAGEYDLLILRAARLDAALIQTLQPLLETLQTPVLLLTAAADPTALPKAVALGIGAIRTAEPANEELAVLATESLARSQDRVKLKQDAETANGKLEERKWVERAKGILMESQGVSENEAFAQLRRISMSSAIPLARIARNMVQATQRPD